MSAVPPGPALTHLDALPPGTRLGEFELRGLLGVGGFGMVYQAYDHSLQRDVAIKEYLPASLARRSAGTAVSIRSSVDTQTFDEGLKSFMNEARLLAQFDHPSLVKVFRFWEENSTAYMVMPLYRGMTLKQARQHMRSPPPEEWLRKVLWSVLGALKVLHNGNTMHRDISPENIFLQDVGPPVLLDLGAARRAIGEKNQQLTATLKFSYAPIEQYGDAPDMRQGPWTDLYSLAAVIHGLLTNELPLPATLRSVRDRLPSFASVAKKVQADYGLSYSTEFVLTMDQALSIKPSGRPKSVNTFARLMELRVPSGMTKFDWRADLGAVYLPPAHAEEEGDGAQDRSMDQTVLLADASSVQARRLAQPRPQGGQYFSAGRSQAAKVRLSKGQWMGLAGVLLGVTLAVAWLGRPSHPTPTVAQTPTLVVPAVVAAPASAQAASEALAPTLSTASTPTAPMPTQLTSVPESEGTKPDRPHVAGTKKPHQSVEVARPAVLAVPVPGGVASAPTLARQPDASSAPVVKPAAPVQVSPETICADRNFLVKPMCIFQECQKPEFSNTAMCQENARRLRESRNPNN